MTTLTLSTLMSSTMDDPPQEVRWYVVEHPTNGSKTSFRNQAMANAYALALHMKHQVLVLVTPTDSLP